MVEKAADEIFIVDNRTVAASGLQLLRDWASNARTLDVATGYFDVGSFLAMEGCWQSTEKIRVLMGDETTKRTMGSLLALGDKVDSAIDKSIEEEKKGNPMLRGVTDLLEAIKSKQIEIRVYDKGKFHAKAYIAKMKKQLGMPRSLVGSSNFTKPGLERNIELNIRINRGDEVGQLVKWFDEHWESAKPIEDHILKVIDRHIRHYTPFEVFAKALQALFSTFEPPAVSEWEQNKSVMFPKLDLYQQEAYWALMKIAHIHKGAFLCDGVGLGKTFVGLMLIERLVSMERKNVALFAPKTARDSVWVPHLHEHLPNIGGTSGLADLSNLVVYSHTDFNKRSKGFPSVFEQIEKNVDVVIVDEAHHFRNPGASGKRNKRPSRYQLLYKLLDTAHRPKTLFMLTATPICNSLDDFKHMTELITRKKPSYFSKTLGIENFSKHLRNTEKLFLNQYGEGTEVEKMKDAKEILSADKLISKLVVQRSRKYATESQKRAHGKSTVFPKRDAPNVAEYSIAETYGQLLDEFKLSFDKEAPLFALPMYSSLRWYTGKDNIDNRQINSQKQVIGLIRTMFIKRFESSIEAFEISCISLLEKLLAFIKKHEELVSTKNMLDDWATKHHWLLEYVRSRHLEFGKTEFYEDDELVPEEITANVEKLDPQEYDLKDMLKAAWGDIEQITKFIKMTKGWEPKHDDKAQKLLKLLQSRDVAGHKTLIFTEYAHTARYLKRLILDQGIEEVAQFDGSSKEDRRKVVKRFAPFYNNESPKTLLEQGEKEITVLISTDVLSEGLNLQDATRLINYDIHWSPVRLMQRIGRVDRRMDPVVEEKIKRETPPDVVATRGEVKFWNFLPPAELSDILTLYKRVTQKTLLISRTFGIEGKKLFTPDDDFEALKEFNEAYEGSAHTELEEVHIEYQKLLQKYPDLEDNLMQYPSAIFSGKATIGASAAGLFFCYRLPIYDEQKKDFVPEGITNWYYSDFDSDNIIEKPEKIIEHIRCMPETKRKCKLTEKGLIEKRAIVENYIRSSYLQKVNTPSSMGPELICWMELNKDFK